MSIELPKMRQEFEDWHGGRYLGLQQEIAWAAWQEAARLALEAAAKVCDDEYQRIMALQKPGRYGSTEEAVNLNLRLTAVMLPECADMIRALRKVRKVAPSGANPPVIAQEEGGK